MSIAKITSVSKNSVFKIVNQTLYPLDTNTKLLTEFNGADSATTDTAETGQTITFEGTAQLDTAQKKFGTSSLLLDGNSDYVTVPDSEDWNFGTGDFTVDFWLRPSSSINSSSVTYVGQYASGTLFWAVQTISGPKVKIVAQNSGAVGEFVTTDAVSIPINTWTHIAYVRNGSNCYIFVNGISKAVTLNVAFGTMPNVTTVLGIGALVPGVTLQYFPGWIDNVRISKGIARWVDDFTVPSYMSKVINVTY